jgi:hypothetical protein
MDIKETKRLLQELSDIGISECVLEPSPTEKDSMLVRGSNKERSIIVYKTVKNLKLVDVPMGIQSVKGLLSRINLFDEEKAGIVLDKKDGSYVKSLTVKQGRKTVTFRTGEPSSLLVPKSVPPCEITEKNCISFQKDYVDYISQAISAMSYTGSNTDRSVGVKVENKTLTLSINDGQSDSFVDTIDGFDVDDVRGTWDISAFNKLIKLSSSLDEDSVADFSISEHGVGVVRIAQLDALIPPLVS